ncbi:MAG: 30S ribosomal protein S3 [Candidatus Kerfeldbacteria bacterium CG15_BIG_FIL_POST_REV_8_21_14_020_45_12]|uniref:Small ribosomal subunit protein uS3 n=1 Tax=Candidatus Kerfeldbacteria bacterium CG15_BIG_FIL_POST_REV_8_21_14_020_45_12 TaxID=2014247 RepID=A0A2M7H3Q6_9BACT|nr:MAG: 30S ribosomal protein S3 [Candidatus Kerfeldbacteria bacterium CG15_BIG_FIL_POST_REV_8_21_14_020_45_12]PJA93990.1 MAG: 30S ribosomal protein S3 [Candidatus Kerfeldbacteria bacterium CG_4_9_14_3_um_filter_45_8]
MGQKVNPRAFRQTTTYKSASRWFASRQVFARNLQTDVEIRKYIRNKFRDGGVALIEIDLSVEDLNVTVHTSKPGVIIGRGGANIEELKKDVKRIFFGSEKMKVNINIQELRDPDQSAELIVQSIRDQLEARVRFRRAMKRALESVMRSGAEGCRIQIAGRLNGAEIARTEKVSQGRLPLHTLRANIDYSRGIAKTIYGVIGIKVWVYSGESFGNEEEEEVKPKKSRRPQQRKRKKSAYKPDAGDKTATILRKKVDVEKEKAEKIVPVVPSEETNS